MSCQALLGLCGVRCFVDGQALRVDIKEILRSWRFWQFTIYPCITEILTWFVMVPPRPTSSVKWLWGLYFTTLIWEVSMRLPCSYILIFTSSTLNQRALRLGPWPRGRIFWYWERHFTGESQRPRNVILVCHSTIYPANVSAGERTRGGPRRQLHLDFEYLGSLYMLL
jgi:hypothetical protein